MTRRGNERMSFTVLATGERDCETGQSDSLGLLSLAFTCFISGNSVTLGGDSRLFPSNMFPLYRGSASRI